MAQGDGRVKIHSSWQLERRAGEESRKKGARDHTQTEGHDFTTHPDIPRYMLYQSPAGFQSQPV